MGMVWSMVWGLMWRVKGEVLCEEVEYGVEG